MELHERMSTPARPVREQEPFAELKNKVHMTVISELGPQLFNIAIDPADLRDRVTADIRRHLNDEAGLAREDRDRLTAEILDDILGYGPLERLIADDSITEIMCNGPDDVWIERGGPSQEARDGGEKGLSRSSPPAAGAASQREESIRVLEHLEASSGLSNEDDPFAPRTYVPGPVRMAPAAARAGSGGSMPWKRRAYCHHRSFQRSGGRFVAYRSCSK